MSRFVYISSMGAVFRLTRRQWRSLCERGAAGQDIDLREIGAVFLGNLHERVTSWEADEFAQELEVT